MRQFCAAHLPSVSPALISLDLEPMWRHCAEGLGLGFNVWVRKMAAALIWQQTTPYYGNRPLPDMATTHSLIWQQPIP